MKFSIIIPFIDSSLNNVLIHIDRVYDKFCKINDIEIIVVLNLIENNKNYKEYIPYKENIKIVCFNIINYPGVNRNIGAKYSSGEYLIFLDGDCIPTDKFIESLSDSILNNLTKNKSIGIITGKAVTKFHSKILSKTFDITVYPYLQGDIFLFPIKDIANFYIIKRSLFTHIGGFSINLRYREDIDILSKTQLLGLCAAYDPNLLVIHMHNRDSWWKFFKYLYTNGFNFQNSKTSNYDSILLMPYYFLIIPMRAAYLTVKALLLNKNEIFKLFFICPIIFLCYFIFSIGRFLNVFKFSKKIF